MNKYTVIVNREQYYEAKNVYVRWDDYSGGDSEWRGGKIQVWSEPHEQKIPRSVKDAVLKWCEHWLPTEQGLSESPGWRIEFEVQEWRETGYRAPYSHAYLRPKLTDAIRGLILDKAAKEMYAALK